MSEVCANCVEEGAEFPFECELCVCVCVCMLQPRTKKFLSVADMWLCFCTHEPEVYAVRGSSEWEVSFTHI